MNKDIVGEIIIEGNIVALIHMGDKITLEPHKTHITVTMTDPDGRTRSTPILLNRARTLKNTLLSKKKFLEYILKNELTNHSLRYSSEFKICLKQAFCSDSSLIH